MNANKKLFLSAVSSEFESYRKLLAGDLKRPTLDVAVQEDFIVTGGSTLEKLDDYIRACDGVVHLIGKANGAVPEVLAAREFIANRCPDLATRSRSPIPASPTPNGRPTSPSTTGGNCSSIAPPISSPPPAIAPARRASSTTPRRSSPSRPITAASATSDATAASLPIPSAGPPSYSSGVCPTTRSSTSPSTTSPKPAPSSTLLC